MVFQTVIHGKSENTGIIIFDDIKALRGDYKESLFFTLDEILCSVAKERGFNCKCPKDYNDSLDLTVESGEFDLMRRWLSVLEDYDNISLGSLMEDTFIHLDAMQKIRLYKIFNHLIENEKPTDIKIITRGKLLYAWDKLGSTEIPVSLVKSMAENIGLNITIEYVGRSILIKNRLYKLFMTSLLNIERLTESFIRFRYGRKLENLSCGKNGDILVFLSNTYNLGVIEPILKILNEEGMNITIVLQSHGFFNFGPNKEELEYLGNFGRVKLFESYQDSSVMRAMQLIRKKFKDDFKRLNNDQEFQRSFSFGKVNMWEVFRELFRFYYYVQFPRIVKYIETGKRIFRVEEPKLVIFKADGPTPDRTFATVANSLNIPTILVSHGIYFPNKSYVPKCKFVTVWGPKFKEYMELKGVNSNDVIITGAPHYDDLIKLKKSKNNFREELNLPDGKIVTFATQGFSEMINQKLVSEVMRVLTEIKDITLVIKPHPREDPEFYRKFFGNSDRTIILPEVDISKLIKASDLLLTVNSTVALESNVIGTPVLTLNFTEEKDDFYGKEGGAISVNDESKLVDVVFRSLFNDEYREEIYTRHLEFLKKYTFNEDAKASERVVELVRQTLAREK